MFRDELVSDQGDVYRVAGLITNASTKASAAAAAAWIESRYVKRRGKVYGPYRIRRWREGGKLRSQYLGKAVKPE